MLVSSREIVGEGSARGIVWIGEGITVLPTVTAVAVAAQRTVGTVSPRLRGTQSMLLHRVVVVEVDKRGLRTL